MKPARERQRLLFLKKVGKLRKGWQDVPTRKLLRQRQVLIEDMVGSPVSISEVLAKVRSKL